MHDLRFLRRVLEVRGYSVHEAETRSIGLSKARNVKSLVILLNINLPAIDGHEVADRFCSGKTDQGP